MEHSDAVESYNRQIELLKRRLIAEPATFRQMFIDDGINAVMWEFSQDELGADFVKELWKVLLREDDASRVIMRFLWAQPLKGKRKFVRALDAHLGDRYAASEHLGRAVQSNIKFLEKALRDPDYLPLWEGAGSPYYSGRIPKADKH